MEMDTGACVLSGGDLADARRVALLATLDAVDELAAGDNRAAFAAGERLIDLHGLAIALGDNLASPPFQHEGAGVLTEEHVEVLQRAAERVQAFSLDLLTDRMGTETAAVHQADLGAARAVLLGLADL